MSGQQLLDQMLQAKPLLDSILIMNREKYLYQMYLSDCRDRGLEPSTNGYFKWKQIEEHIIISAESYVDEIMQESPF